MNPSTAGRGAETLSGGKDARCVAQAETFHTGCSRKGRSVYDVGLILCGLLGLLWDVFQTRPLSVPASQNGVLRPSAEAIVPPRTYEMYSKHVYVEKTYMRP